MTPLTVGCSALLTDVASCLNHFRMASPGLYCCVHVQVELSDKVSVTPGIVMMVNHGRLKKATPLPDYQRFRGAPDFIADVFPSVTDTEYKNRVQMFANARVAEYLAVFDSDPLTWHWHTLVGDSFQLVRPDDDGILRSPGLPGLWVPQDAFAKRDWWTIMATITRGVTRRGHHDFMNTIFYVGSSEPACRSPE